MEYHDHKLEHLHLKTNKTNKGIDISVKMQGVKVQVFVLFLLPITAQGFSVNDEDGRQQVLNDKGDQACILS